MKVEISDKLLGKYKEIVKYKFGIFAVPLSDKDRTDEIEEVIQCRIDSLY